MTKRFTIDLTPIRSERLSPVEYLKLQKDIPTLIEQARFVPPKPGAPGFGSFEVRYTSPRLKSLAHG